MTSTLAQDLGGVVRLLVPEPKPLPDLLLATYHEARGWNACRDAMLKLIGTHSTEIAGALRDAERMDYIERTFSGMTNRERYLPVQMIWGKGANGRTLREACDKYMQRESAMQQGGGGGEAAA